jgi:nitrate reductase delta subunit
MSWWRRVRSGGERSPDAIPVYAAAAAVLSYPDDRLLERLDALADLVNAAGAAEWFAPVWAYLRPGGEASQRQHLIDLQAAHVQEFDISRRHALHLTYWIDGDTRRRGESLLRYKQVYRDSGLLVDLAGELPDYLPMVLEFAVHDPVRGRALLESSRPALELLRLGLRDDNLPHEGVLDAICATLPGESPGDRLAVSRMQGWQPPVETVGLAGVPAPYGSRLPLIDTSQIE